MCGWELKIKVIDIIFIISVCKNVIVIILCLSWFYLQLSITKIFRLMSNETLMNILFPDFAINLFLMSHEHFCIPTPEHATWLSCHLGAQIPFSCKCFMTVWTCSVFWGGFLGAGIFFGRFLVGVFLPLMGVVASAVAAFYKASYKPHWMYLSFTAFKPF